LKNKLKVITKNYTSGLITNDVFIIASEEINKEIKEKESDIK